MFFTQLADPIHAARQRGIAVLEQLSIVVLGNHIRAEQTGCRFTSFSIPREAMGRAATEMLVRRVENDEPIQQIMLPSEPGPRGNSRPCPFSFQDEIMTAKELHAKILVVGGGLGGVAAALGALRNGRTVIMSEEFDWLGDCPPSAPMAQIQG